MANAEVLQFPIQLPHNGVKAANRKEKKQHNKISDKPTNIFSSVKARKEGLKIHFILLNFPSPKSSLLIRSRTRQTNMTHIHTFMHL